MNSPNAPTTLTLKKPTEPDLRLVLRQCASDLEAAANIRISHMDSDSRVAALNAERIKVMLSVAARLRQA